MNKMWRFSINHKMANFFLISYWVAYLIILVPVFFFVKKGRNYTFLDALILSNGFTAFVNDIILFLWILPEFFNSLTLYPGPSTLISVTVAVIDGLELRARSVKKVAKKRKKIS